MKKECKGPLKGNMPEGKYANYFEIGHAVCEFLLDFAQLYQGRGKADFHTRIIITPQGAKALQDTLRKSINAYARYEQGAAVPTVDKLTELLRALEPESDYVLQKSIVQKALVG